MAAARRGVAHRPPWSRFHTPANKSIPGPAHGASARPAIVHPLWCPLIHGGHLHTLPNREARDHRNSPHKGGIGRRLPTSDRNVNHPPGALVSSLVARIEDLGRDVNAFTHTFFDHARDDAGGRRSGALARGARPRPLDGLPVAITDLHDVKGEGAALRASPQLAFSPAGCATE